MAEQNAFETRLQIAVRGYVGRLSSDLDPALLARTIAAAEPRRRGLGTVLRRPAIRVPSIAWLLFIVALVSLAAGVALFLGSRPDGKLPAVVPSDLALAECPPGSTPDLPGPTDQARPLSENLRMAFDRDSGRIVAVVPDDLGAGWTTWTFDVCANAWAGSDAVGAPGPGNPPAWPRPYLVYDPDADLTIAIDRDGAAVRAYDVESDTWRTMGERPPLGGSASRSVHDPSSGLVYVQQISPGDETAASQPLWTYEVGTDTWHEVLQTGAIPPGTSGDHLVLAWDASVGRMVAVQSHLNRPATWQLDPRTGAWTASTGITPRFNTGLFGSGSEIAYDEAAGRTIVFSDGKVGAYDATRDDWETVGGGVALGEGPFNRLGHAMAYDPLNERLVVAGGQYRLDDGWVRADDVWVFDLATGTWTELLPAGRIERYDPTTETWIEQVGSGSASSTPIDR